MTRVGPVSMVNLNEMNFFFGTNCKSGVLYTKKKRKFRRTYYKKAPEVFNIELNQFGQIRFH